MKIVWIILFLLFAAQCEAAATRYVATNGSGSACTVISTPCTMATAISQLLAGDTLYLRGGTYTTVFDATTKNGTSGLRITIAPYPGEDVVIRPAGCVGEVFDFGNYTTVDGGSATGVQHLHIDGINCRDGVNSLVVMGLGGVGSVGQILTYVEISNCTDNCIQVVRDTQGPTTISHNLLHDTFGDCYPGRCDHPGSYAIYNEGSNSTIEYNKMYNSVSFGLHLYGAGSPPPNNNIVRFNEFYNNCTQYLLYPSVPSYAGAIIASGDNNQFYGNISRGNHCHGLDIDSGASNSKIYNNVFYGNQEGGITPGSQSGTIVRNNLISNNGYVWGASGAGSVTHDHNFCASGCVAPDTSGTIGWLNAAGNDFHLTAGSSATVRDGGVNLSALIPAFTTDYYGAPINSGTSGWPIGAAEYQTVVANSIASVTWTNSRTGGTGNATAPLTAWSISSVPLLPGINPISVCATDTNGNSACDSLTVTYAPTFPGNALVGAWAFDEVAGTSAVDSSGAGNPGSLISGATRANGIFPPSLSLNAASNQFVTVSNAASINFTQGFTYSAWVNPSQAHSDYRSIFERSIYGIGSVQGLFGSVAGYCGNGAVAATMTVNGSIGPTYTLCDAVQLVTNRWTHLAISYDGATFKLYRDGVLDQSVAASGYMETPQDKIQNNSLGIGAHPSGAQYFDGMIDEARVYNYAIPLVAPSSKTNVTPNAACDYADTAPSIIHDMNCRIISPVPPLTFKIPAAATALQIGPGTTFKVGQP